MFYFLFFLWSPSDYKLYIRYDKPLIESCQVQVNDTAAHVQGSVGGICSAIVTWPLMHFKKNLYSSVLKWYRLRLKREQKNFHGFCCSSLDLESSRNKGHFDSGFFFYVGKATDAILFEDVKKQFQWQVKCFSDLLVLSRKHAMYIHWHSPGGAEGRMLQRPGWQS